MAGASSALAESKQNTDGEFLTKIEPAQREHLPEIAALAGVIWRACYPGIISPEQIEYMLRWMYSLEKLQAELDAGIRFDRLLCDGTLVGFAAYGPEKSEMKLHKLYLHPDFHRRGLGTRLLLHVEEQSRKAGFNTLVLGVNKGNSQAIAAYKKNGFTIRGSVITEIGGGFVMDDFIMARVL